AREIGVEHIVENVTPNQAVAMLDDVISSCGEPFADYSVFPTMLISRAARRHVKVMLSGDGGDELFWGYPDRSAPMLQESSHFRHPYRLRTIHARARNLLGLGIGHPHFRFESIGDWYRAMHSRISEEHLHAVFPDVPAWPLDFRLFVAQDSSPRQLAGWL